MIILLLLLFPIWCSSYYISTPHWGQNTFRRLTHPFPSHFPSHRAWEESFPATPPPGRILPSAHAMAAAAPTMDASTAAHRGAGDTGGERKGEDGTVVAGRQRMAWFSAQVVAARLARSVSQHHPAVQGTATARSSSSSPASPWYQRPTFFKAVSV